MKFVRRDPISIRNSEVRCDSEILHPLITPQMATASECRYRWLRLPDLNLPMISFRAFRQTIGENIADSDRVGKSGALIRYQPNRTIRVIGGGCRQHSRIEAERDGGP
jgi:hypothetical protein